MTFQIKDPAKWYLQNLRCGLRTAFFFPTTQPFVGSWNALMAISATAVLSQLSMEYSIDGTGGELDYSFAEYLTCLFSFTLIVSYIVSFFARGTKPVLDIAVSFLNSYYFIFIAYAFIQIVAEDKFYDSGLGPLALRLIPIWAFLVMFRIASITCAADLRKLVASGLLAAGAIYLLNSQIHFNRIYYVEPPTAQVQPSALDKLTAEELFGMQADLRQKALEKLKVSRPGHTDIYALTFASYSYQDVFMRDVRYAEARLKDRLGITNILPMINNKETVETTPLADATNLKSYLQALSPRFMQPKQDILLLFLSSHGSAEQGLAVNLGYKFSMLGLSPPMLQKILNESGIQNKVIIISACHSGAFIPFLKDEHTMIITAAAANKVSFGCSDTNNLTYFTQAYFMDGLSQTSDLEKAFVIAKDAVEKRETSMGITDHSNPQIFVGSKIREALRNYARENAASLRHDTEAAPSPGDAAAQGYAPAPPLIAPTQEIKKEKALLNKTANLWMADSLYGVGLLLLVLAGVVYRSNPELFRRGGWKSGAVARSIFKPAVYKAYLCCLGIIVIFAWLAWCVVLMSE